MTSHEIKETPGAVTPGETFTVEQLTELFTNISNQVDGLEVTITIKTGAAERASLNPRKSTFGRGGVM